MNVFVIMPLDSKLNSVYEKLIKEPLELRGYTVRRADDSPQDQNILRTIVKGIWNADVVVTDLTQTNANVYYELGMAHALEKQTIQIVQNLDDVLFDLRPYYVIEYSTHFDKASDLTAELMQIFDRKKEDEYKFSNPVSDFIYRDLEGAVDSPNDVALHSSTDQEDDAQMGTLEALVDAEDSMEEIADLVTDVSAELNDLGSNMQSHTKNINRLAANPNQRGINKKKLQAVRLIAMDMNKFSDVVEKQVPQIDRSWSKLDQGLRFVLLSASIRNDSDLESVCSFIENMAGLQKSVQYAKSQLATATDALAQGMGVARDTDRAFRRSEKTLNMLVNGLGYGDSVLANLIAIATDIVNRYRAK